MIAPEIGQEMKRENRRDTRNVKVVEIEIGQRR
jgi:hypothetical protein